MKSVRWRFTGAVAVSAMVITPLIALPASADSAETSIGDLTVLGTTDVHGNVFNWDYFADSVPTKEADQRGLARVATVAEQVRAAKGAESVVMVDNGDFIQGTPLTYLAAEQPDKLVSEGHPMAEALKAIGYDAQNLGNHEFNYGLDFLEDYQGQVEGSGTPLLGANVETLPGTSLSFEPYVILDKVVGGQTIKVGILGLVTPGVRIWDKANVEGKLVFHDLVLTAQEYVPQMKAEGADVVVANDPDADRCAVAAVVDGAWRMLTGDELGAILGDDAIRRGVSGTFANSIVSSTLLGRMASAAGRDHQTTLTGFKWIGRVPDLAFGYEEAIGYCVDSRAVPDKDGITAAVSVLRVVAELRAQGRTLADRLDEIARVHGLTATSQLAVRVADLGIIADAMARLRGNPPTQLLGEPVTVVDLAHGSETLPPTDGIELTGPRVHVVARPSGTEPKLKCYLEVRLDPAESQDVAVARTEAAGRLDRLRAEMAAALGV